MIPTFKPRFDASIERVEFARKLVKQLRDRNMNQSDLARRAGLSRDAISTYARGRSMPEPANLEKIAKALGCKPEDLLLPAMSNPASPVDFPLAPPPQPEEGVHLETLTDGNVLLILRARMPLTDAMAIIETYQKKGKR